MRTLALALAALAPITLPLPALAQDEKPRIARMAVEVEEKSITELSAMLAAGTISSEELARAYLDRIDALDRKGPQLNSVIAVMPGAIEEARMLDAERKAGTLRGPLHG
ncbi:MAG: amidase, partial [Blastomonas fulva]